MSYYQKVYALITLAIVGVTVAVIGVCFQTPYSAVFITECLAILFAELLMGAICIRQATKSDSVLPYSLISLRLGWGYLVFVFLMMIPACLGIGAKYFILLHVIGAVFAGIRFVIFSVGERNIVDQEISDRSQLSAKESFTLQMSNIVNELTIAFPSDATLKRDSARMLDNLRYAATSTQATQDLDAQMLDLLGKMNALITACDSDDYRTALNSLKTLYSAREEKAKLQR